MCFATGGRLLMQLNECIMMTDFVAVLVCLQMQEQDMVTSLTILRLLMQLQSMNVSQA